MHVFYLHGFASSPHGGKAQLLAERFAPLGVTLPLMKQVARALATVPYLTMHDPDGRPRSLRRRDAF